MHLVLKVSLASLLLHILVQGLRYRRFSSRMRLYSDDRWKGAYSLAGLVPFGQMLLLSHRLKGSGAIYLKSVRGGVLAALPFWVGQSFFWKDVRILYLVGFHLLAAHYVYGEILEQIYKEIEYSLMSEDTEEMSG